MSLLEFHTNPGKVKYYTKLSPVKLIVTMKTANGTENMAFKKC